MRHSTARLVNTAIRLAELRFPTQRVLIHRTRAVFIHLDNVLHFAKVDRDGRVDGFLVAFLPDEVIVLFLRKGEVATCVAITPEGRSVRPLGAALTHIREETERGELFFADAPLEQLAWMYQSCAAPATPRAVDQKEPEQLFPALHKEQFTGVLELISEGRVNYLRFEQGTFRSGYFCDKPEEMPVPRYLESLFANTPEDLRPDIAVHVFDAASEVPTQALPELIQTYRHIYWSIARAADLETAGAAIKHAYRLRELLRKVHTPLDVIGEPLDRPSADIVTTPEALTSALSDWALQFLEQVEIVAPASAPAILRDATKEQRFVLQRAGFYDRLPWTVRW